MNKKKQVAQLCLTPHLVCNIMVKLKVCLFIPCFYVSLNSKNPCSIWCTLFMYILKKKNSRFPNLSQKKRKFFKKKKKKSLDWGNWALKSWALNFLVTFSKRPIFFLSKISRFFKVFFSKWYMRIPWTKHFLNLNV